MKQTATIFLLVIFSFNMFGYRVLYNLMSNRADTNLELALDEKEYNDADLVSIKQATNLPYYSNSNTFKRMDGEINVDGTIYKYVKVRVYKDSLEMLCIPHVAKMKILDSEKEFYKMVNEFNTKSNNKKSGSDQKQVKLVVYEFEELHNSNLLTAPALLLSNLFYYTTPATLETAGKSAERPPDATFSNLIS